MAERRVWVFFYGSYMNADVLASLDLVPQRVEIARLAGFDIRIEPLANLVPSDRDCVYGILTTATHAELDRLYHHAQHVLGAQYLPEAVLVETSGGTLRPALCYVAPVMTPGPVGPDYLERILWPARIHGFPEWYIARLESFRP